MSFVWAERMRHHSLAADALRSGRLSEAAFHTAMVAECSLQLAEEMGGPVGRAYLKDANELIGFAQSIRARAAARPVTAGTVSAASTHTDNDDDADGSEWLVEEKPNVRLDDVAGLDDVKLALRDAVVWPRLYPERYERFRKKPQAGVLMYGPPGNGKTYIARAVAGELDAAFFSVNPATLKSKWVGKSEKNVKRLFNAAAKHERAIIFIDECDALLASGQNEKVNIFNQFLTELDGIGTRRDSLFSRFVLAATNKPWLLGDAVLRPGRLGEHVYVGLPDAAARRSILEGCLAGVPVEEGLDIAALAERLDGRSGADLAWLVERAKDRAIEREVLNGGYDCVTAADLEQLSATTPASVSPQDVARHLEWKANRSGE